jgi:hypothetical protein
MKRSTALLAACLLAACGGSQDSGAMMDEESGMMADSAQMNEPMQSEMMEGPGMAEDSSAMGGVMGDSSAMGPDTSQMRRP